MHTELFKVELIPGLTSVYIPASMNSYIKPNFFYDGIEEIIFNNKFNSDLDVGLFPRSLKKLVLGKRFNKEIKKDVLPQDLDELILGYQFDKEIYSDSLPVNLKKLVLGNNYKKEIQCSLPKCHIYVNVYYTLPIPPNYANITFYSLSSNKPRKQEVVLKNYNYKLDAPKNDYLLGKKVILYNVQIIKDMLLEEPISDKKISMKDMLLNLNNTIDNILRSIDN